MLYKYKKDYQKIAMGLLSFIAELKDISRLQSELKWYDAEDNRNLYLWKDDSNDFVGIVGIEENDDIVIVRHITVSPAVRNEGVSFKILDDLQNLYSEKKIMGNIETTNLITKWEMKNGSAVRELDQFEGPLDLLLHLIKQNEMDIYDIQVAEITSQYIDYLHQMQDLRLDIAGEYLVIAATLLNIKSKMLLPVEQEQQVEEDYVDPREDLVQQLVSHQLYQEVAAKFHVMEKQRMELFSREQAVNEDVTYEVSEGTTIDLLQKAFAKLMARKQVKKIKKIKREIIPERYTIKEEIENIEHTLKMHKGTMNFTDLFDFDGEVEVEKVVTSFLALLELVRVGRVSASQEENNGPILMTYEGKAEEDAI